MKILKTVTVKQVLTEKSRESLFNKFATDKRQLEKECEQLRFEQKKVEKTKKGDTRLFINQIEKEINKRKEKIKLVDFQIEQLDILELGSELKEQEVQALIDVNIGDNWESLMKDQTIIIKDGSVSEIRS